jgi:hypothetical protein
MDEDHEAEQLSCMRSEQLDCALPREKDRLHGSFHSAPSLTQHYTEPMFSMRIARLPRRDDLRICPLVKGSPILLKNNFAWLDPTAVVVYEHHNKGLA